jgi:DNA topoisomerase-3
MSQNNVLKKLCSVPETTRWEEELEKDSAAFVESVKGFVREAVESAVDAEYSRPPAGACPVCGKPVTEGKLSFSCSGWKDSGCKFTIWKTIAGAAVSAADAALILSGKKTKPKKCKSKAGKDFEARFFLKGDHSVGFETEPEKRPAAER